MSIRFKVILPYLLLTLIVAVTGVYVVTKLVASSLSERLTNQLLEAGRVVSDEMVLQERSHLETARIIAYTSGLGEALRDDDRAAVVSLAKPVAGGLGVEDLIIVNSQGQEVLHLLEQVDGSLLEGGGTFQPNTQNAVQQLLVANDPNGLPTREIQQDPLDKRYYYFTAIPVVAENQMVGVVVIGSSLDTILPRLKSTSLADVIIYGENGRALATTLTQMSDPAFMATISIPEETYQQNLASDTSTDQENFAAGGRGYSLTRSSLRVGDDRLGVFAVVLPSNFVLQPGAASRNTYVLLFSLAMVAVVLVGYVISRLIINPIYALMHTSQAISGGDLTKRTGIVSADEIGVLANTFDEMTANLQQRTIELEKTNRILEQMDRTKVTFIQISAHELRTPLTLIQGYAQMLELRANSDPELGTLARGILDGSNRMSDVVNSMLDVSRIDSKTLKIVPTQTELDLLIKKAQKPFKEALKERNLSLENRGLENLPLVPADSEQLYKAFYHIIMNSIKYTPDGGKITVTGQLVNGDSEPTEVEIVVSDTGVGIDAQYHELVFEKFFQTGEVHLHSSGKTKFKGGGPGLGLAIARGIIEAHHGRIWVESPGFDDKNYPGSAFHVRLPLVNGREK